MPRIIYEYEFQNNQIVLIEEICKRRLVAKTLYVKCEKNEGRGGHSVGGWFLSLPPLRPKRTGVRRDLHICTIVTR